MKLTKRRANYIWYCVKCHNGFVEDRGEWRRRVPRDRYERRRQRLINHIAECETALGRRREIISELTHRVKALTNENAELRRRAMPEGYEWPRYESGESVGFGDDVSRHGEDFEANAITLYRDGSFSLNFWAYSKGERVKRPAPAVLAADGKPLEVGQTVWDVGNGVEFTVIGLPNPGEYQAVKLRLDDGAFTGLDPDQLTHQRPDTWQRIEEDALNFVEDNAGIPHDQDQMERDMLTILRRCKALAERERGE